MLELRQAVDDFSYTATSGQSGQLSDFRGQWLVLYFYPKDSTPGCTTESCDFRDKLDEFQQHNATILGISRDSLKSHENFKTKQALPFELISDATEELCTLFDVIKMKNNFGRQVRGIERSTFLIDPEGKLHHQWRKVKVKGHVEEVLETLKQQ